MLCLLLILSTHGTCFINFYFNGIQEFSFFILLFFTSVFSLPWSIEIHFLYFLLFYLFFPFLVLVFSWWWIEVLAFPALTMATYDVLFFLFLKPFSDFYLEFL